MSPTTPSIYATSDLHGGEIACRPPECDIFIIAGDVCPMDDHGLDRQLKFLDRDFRVFLERIPAKNILGIAGNHDFVFEQWPDRVAELELPWTYLQDSSVEIYQPLLPDEPGLKFYGLPWVPNLVNWAFYGTKQQLAERYEAIPKDTDIVISHGPPFFMGDLSKMGGVNCGARQANDMMGRVKPKAFVCGHIHEGHGSYRYRGQHGSQTDVYNVSFLDEHYSLRYPDPIVNIKIDASENETDIEREIRGAHPDEGHTEQSPEESSSGVSAVVDATGTEVSPLDS